MILDYLFTYLKEELGLMKPIDDLDFKFIYIGNRGLCHSNVITIAYYIFNNEVVFGAAFSNINDRYNKFFGKNLAEERAKSNPTKLKLDTKEIDYRKIATVICRNLLENKKTPAWAKFKLALHLVKLQ